MPIIELRNVKKSFNGKTALDDISFSVDRGVIFGVLGPNGAGKTTAIRIITQIIPPDEGEAILFDGDASFDVRNKIGYLPEERGLYKKVKVLEQLIYFGELKGMKRSEASKSAKNWLARLEALEWKDKKINELSKGMQQKVQFVSAIVHDPDLLILDEPFSGFDPVNVESLKNILLELKESGKTIFISTHVMEQVEKICDEIILIDKGKILLSGSTREIKRSRGKDTIVMEFEGSDSFVQKLPFAKILNQTRNRLEFRINPKKVSPNEILEIALKEGAEIYRFELEEPSLNEIFIDIVSTAS